MFGYVIIETAWADIDLHFLLLKSFMGSLYDLYIQSNIFPKHAFYVQHATTSIQSNVVKQNVVWPSIVELGIKTWQLKEI